MYNFLFDFPLSRCHINTDNQKSVIHKLIQKSKCKSINPITQISGPKGKKQK